MTKKSISYTDAIAEIEDIIDKIDNNEVDVDELGIKVKRVAELLKICKAKLKSTEEDVEKILRDFED